MHGSHSTSLKLKENNRTSLFARQEWCFRHWAGALIVKVAEGLGSWISQSGDLHFLCKYHLLPKQMEGKLWSCEDPGASVLMRSRWLEEHFEIL